MSRADLRGVRVLIVEDEPTIAAMIDDLLSDEGCRVCGPHLTFAGGAQAARTAAIDVAILDVNLAGDLSYPLGEILAGRGIPFVLTSGEGAKAAPADHPEWATCGKPFASETLLGILRDLVS